MITKESYEKALEEQMVKFRKDAESFSKRPEIIAAARAWYPILDAKSSFSCRITDNTVAS